MHRLPILIFFLLVINPTFSNSQEYYGTISSDTTWSGDITITGDILVDSNATLTILPGTVVSFAANQNTAPLTSFITDDSSIFVKGGLIANGTSTSPIKFTSDALSPSPGDWAVILFEEMTSDSSFKHCIIEYGGDMINSTGSDSDYLITVQNSILKYAEDVGILLGNAGNADIQYNTFYATGNAVEMHKSNDIQKNFIIKNNIIVNCDGGITNNSKGLSYTTTNNNLWNPAQYNEYGGGINHQSDISVDPEFSDSDFHLSPSSPCLTVSDTGGEIGAYGSLTNSKTTVQSDLSFQIPNAVFNNMNLQLNFSFLGEQNGNLLWELTGYGTTPSTGALTSIETDFSFSVTDATYNGLNLSLYFKFFGDQNGILLWKLYSYKID